LRKAGIAEEELQDYLGEANLFDLHPDNGEAADWFLLLQRRWLVSEMSGTYLRLDDQAILAQMTIRGLKKAQRDKLFMELMLMESAALEILNKKKE